MSKNVQSTTSVATAELVGGWARQAWQIQTLNRLRHVDFVKRRWRRSYFGEKTAAAPF